MPASGKMIMGYHQAALLKESRNRGCYRLRNEGEIPARAGLKGELSSPRAECPVSCPCPWSVSCFRTVSSCLSFFHHTPTRVSPDTVVLPAIFIYKNLKQNQDHIIHAICNVFPFRMYLLTYFHVIVYFSTVSNLLPTWSCIGKKWVLY